MFPFTRLVFLVASLHLVQVSAYNVPRAALSSFAGETTSFVFLPNATVTVPDPNFPDASVVGFPGPTPSLSLFSSIPVIQLPDFALYFVL